jgi:hypothetical protein
VGADTRDQPPTAARYAVPLEGAAMILIGLVIIIIAALMMVVVSRIGRKL